MKNSNLLFSSPALLKKYQPQLASLEKKISLRFQNPTLLLQSLIHRSYLNEASFTNLVSNERMEFLGDAVLEFVTSDFLYQELPETDEGDLTNIRSFLVRTSTLAKIATEISLGQFLLLSKGEEDSGGRENESLLADGFESLLGAIFLDQGLEACQKFIKTKLRPEFKELINKNQFKDYKSLLQEKIQAEEKITPTYKVLSEAGPDHSKTFTVAVLKDRQVLGQAQGQSKQEAEQKAAQFALEKNSKK